MVVKNPACTENALRSLYLIKDALKRNGYAEAVNYATDSLATIQNEIEWCYNTDNTLVLMRDYFTCLLSTLTSIQYSIPEQRKVQVVELLNVLKTTAIDIANYTENHATHKHPDRYLDAIEMAYRSTTSER